MRVLTLCVQLLMCGSSEFSVTELRRHHTVTEHSAAFEKVLAWFWTALENFSCEELLPVLLSLVPAVAFMGALEIKLSYLCVAVMFLESVSFLTSSEIVNTAGPVPGLWSCAYRCDGMSLFVDAARCVTCGTCSLWPPAEEGSRLLQFTTGCARLPAGGFAELMPKFQISSYPEFGALPVAHTW